MSLTREQWASVDERLKSLWGRVRLLIDGYQVTLEMSRVGRYELAIVIWINGEFRGKWLIDECEERRRFFQPVKRRFIRNTTKLQKALGKRRAAEFSKETERTYYSHVWKSFTALKRHLIANNQSIELIEETPI